VDRVHSGRDRASSRQACIDYLNGNPSSCSLRRSGSVFAGFPEMLAKRKALSGGYRRGSLHFSNGVTNFARTIACLDSICRRPSRARSGLDRDPQPPLVQDDIAVQWDWRSQGASFTVSGATIWPSK